MTSDTICIQAWKIHVARKKPKGGYFQEKSKFAVTRRGLHYCIMLTFMHVLITDSTDSSWLNMTWHLVLQSVTVMRKSRGQCVLYFFPFFFSFFPQPSFSMNHIRHCVHKERQKKKGSSVLQLETVACSCCVVLCCVQRKSSLLSRHNNKPACQSRERYLVICPQPHVSLIHSKWSKLRQYVHTRSEIVFGNF